MTTDTENSTMEKVKSKAASTLSDLSEKVGDHFGSDSNRPSESDSSVDAFLKDAASHVYRTLHNHQSYLEFEPLEDVQLQKAVDSVKQMIDRHIGDLSGKYRVVQNVLTEQDDSFSDETAKVSGTVAGFAGQWKNDLAFLKYLISKTNELIIDYAQLHALTLAFDKEMAAGMVWSHMRDWQINRNHLMNILYERTITEHCTGKPCAPVVDKALEEWIQSTDSALTNVRDDSDETHS